jgi:hypothetical protein
MRRSVRGRGAARRARVSARAVFSEKLCALCDRGKHSFTMGSANFSQSIDSKGKSQSRALQNNSNLTMFAQKGFIPHR